MCTWAFKRTDGVGAIICAAANDDNKKNGVWVGRLLGVI